MKLRFLFTFLFVSQILLAQDTPNIWSSQLATQGWKKGLRQVLLSDNKPDKIEIKDGETGRKIALVTKDRNGNYYTNLYSSSGNILESYYGLTEKNIALFENSLENKIQGSDLSFEFSRTEAGGKSTKMGYTAKKTDTGKNGTNTTNGIKSKSYNPNAQTGKSATTINPPFKKLNVKKEVFTFSAEKGAKLVSDSGTIITVPPSAFVTKTGVPVTGDVNLVYSDYKDVTSMLISGIPMMISSGDDTVPFNSAGMFEIRAYKNNEELQLEKNKTLDIEFKSTSAELEFNFYKLDDNTGQWEEKIKADDMPLTLKEGKLSPAVRKYFIFLQRDRYDLDFTPIEKRLPDTSYTFVYCKNDNRYNKPVHVKVGYKKNTLFRNYDNTIFRRADRLVVMRPIVVKKTNLVYIKITSSRMVHPELEPFKDLVLAYECKNYQEATKLKSTINLHRLASNMELKQQADGFTMVIKDGTGISEYNGWQIGNLNRKLQFQPLENTANFMKHYSQDLADRNAHLNQLLKKQKLEHNCKFRFPSEEEAHRYAYNHARSEMNEEELKLTFEKWEENLKGINRGTINNLIFDPNNPANNLAYRFSLSGLGIYNCDQIKRLYDPQQLNASVLHNNKAVKIETVFILDSKINGVITFYNLGKKETYFAISNPEERASHLFFVGSDGNVYHCTSKEVARYLNSKSPSGINVNLFENENATQEKLKKTIAM